MAPKPLCAGNWLEGWQQQARLVTGGSGKAGWRVPMKRGGQHATSKVFCQQPVCVPPSPSALQGSSTASSIGQLQHPTSASGAAAARQQGGHPTLSTPQKAGGKRGFARFASERRQARQRVREEAMQRFEAAVKATTERPELKDLMAQHAKEVRKLDPSEIVLVCNQMAKLCDPQRMPWKAWREMQGWATQMLALLDPYLEQLSTFELVVLLAALARMHYSPSTEWLTHYFGVTMTRIPNCGPGHLTLMLRALSRLEAGLWQLKTAPNFKQWMERMLDAAESRLRAFKGRELVHLLQALADMRWMPSHAWLASYSAIFRRRLDLLDPPLLSTAMLAFATLKYDPGIPLAHAMYTNMATNLPLFEAKDLATTAQAIATVRKRLQRRDFLDGFMAEVQQKLPTFGIRTLANLLHALATLVSHGLIRPNTAMYPVGAPQLQPQQSRQQQQQLQQQQQQQQQVHLQQQIALQQAEVHQAARHREQPDQQQQQQQQGKDRGQHQEPLSSTQVAGHDENAGGSGSSPANEHLERSSGGVSCSSVDEALSGPTRNIGREPEPQPSRDRGASSLSASSSSNSNSSSNTQGTGGGSSAPESSIAGSQNGSSSSSSSNAPVTAGGSSAPESRVAGSQNGSSGSSSSGGGGGGVVRSGGSIDWSRSSIDWSSGSVDWSASSIDESGSRSLLHDGPSGRLGAGAMRVARPTRHAPPEDMSSTSSSSSSGAASPASGQPSPAMPFPTSPATSQSTSLGASTNVASSSPSPDSNLNGVSSSSRGSSPARVPAAAGPTAPWAPPLVRTAPPLPFQLPRAIVWTTVPSIPGSPSSGPVRLPAPSLTWLDATAQRVHELMPQSNGGSIATAVWGLSMLGLPASQVFLDDFVATTHRKLTEMTVDELVYTVQALSNFRYRPSHMPTFKEWLQEFSRLAERRHMDARQVCDLVPAMSGLPLPPPQSLVCTLLTRMRKNRPNAIRHASPRRLANLALSFRAIGYKPDFGFLHLYAQAVRFYWSNFEPWEYAAVLSGMASFSPSSLIIDELWLADLLTMIQCKAHKFDAASVSYTLQAAAHLTRQKAKQPFAPPLPQLPSKQWSYTLLSRVHMVIPSLTPPQAIMVLCYLATRHQANGHATPPPPQPIFPTSFDSSKHSSSSSDSGSSNGAGNARHVVQGQQPQQEGQQPQTQQGGQQPQQQAPFTLAPPLPAVPLVPSQVLFPAQPFQHQPPLPQTMPFPSQAANPPQPAATFPGHSTAQQPSLPAQAPLPFHPHPSLQRASAALPQHFPPSSPHQPSLSQQPLHLAPQQHQQPLHHVSAGNSRSSSSDSSQLQHFPPPPPPSPPPISAPVYPPPLVSPAAVAALSQTSGASPELLADLVAKATMHPGLLSPMQATDLLWALRILGISLPYPVAAAMQTQAQGPLRSGQQQQQPQQQQQQQQHDFWAVQPSRARQHGRPPSPRHMGKNTASSSLGGWDHQQQQQQQQQPPMQQPHLQPSPFQQQQQQGSGLDGGDWGRYTQTQAPHTGDQHMVSREDASRSWQQQHNVEYAGTGSSSNSHGSSWTDARSTGRGGGVHSKTSDVDLSQGHMQARQQGSRPARVMVMRAPDQTQKASTSPNGARRRCCQSRGPGAQRGDAGTWSAGAVRVRSSRARGRSTCDASQAHAWMMRQRRQQQS